MQFIQVMAFFEDEFAKALEKNKIAFIGPNRKAIVSMGDKIKSKKIAEEANVNVIPGYTKAIKDERSRRNSKEIGYPVILKTSAGGGRGTEQFEATMNASMVLQSKK